MTFEFDRVPLLDGTYLVTLALETIDEGTVYDWREQQYSFSVLNPEQSVGLVALPVKVKFADGERTARRFLTRRATDRGRDLLVDLDEPVGAAIPGEPGDALLAARDEVGAAVRRRRAARTSRVRCRPRSVRRAGPRRRAPREAHRPRSRAPACPRSSPRAAGARTLRSGTGTRAPSRRRADPRALGVVDAAGDPDPVARARGRVRGVELGGVPTPCTGEHEMEVGVGGGDVVERADECRQVLARFDRADGEDIAVEPASGWPARGSPADTSGTPLWTTWMRSLGTPKTSATSSATNSETVWTCAPRRSARRISCGYCTVFASQYSGWCTGVRSCTVTSCAGVPGGRHDEVRAVHDVDRSGPVLDRRPVERASRAGGSCGPGSRGGTVMPGGTAALNSSR